jgi:hypothetical protein
MDVGGSTFIFINWRLCLKLNQGLKWQLESVDECHMPFRFLTFLVPWLKENRLTSHVDYEP